MSDLTSHLATALGAKGWLTGPDCEPYTRDWLGRASAAPIGVARPASTAEAVAVVTACREAGAVVIPQGGRTGLCFGSVPDEPGSVVLSLERMNRIHPVQAGGTVQVGAGVVLAALHAALAETGFMFPMHLGSEGSAQIGGLIATNAGGNHAFRYGMMGDLVLGLEAVLADGTVWDGMRAVQKDNAGYQLRRLFCGAEGTLGIVTQAVLKLVPAPGHRATALLALPDAESAVAFGVKVRAEASDVLIGLEFFSALGLELIEKHISGIRSTLETRGGVYLLVELASSSAAIPLEAMLGELLEWGTEHNLVVDGTIAASESQRRSLWKLREEQPEGQRLEGAQLKHDISVPPERIADFIAQGSAICAALLPGVRVNPFGHLADGNIHFNLSAPNGSDGFGGLDGEIGLALARLATEMGGSFAAEHGLGRSKIALADTLRSPAERAIMRRLKQAFDPDTRLNPGVIVRR